MSTIGFCGEVTSMNPSGSISLLLELPRPFWLRADGKDDKVCDDGLASTVELILPFL